MRRAAILAFCLLFGGFVAEGAAPLESPPALWLEAYRLDASGRSDEALRRLRDGLRKDPENLWLHFARQGIGSNGSERPYLELDYRAFLEKAAGSPKRRILLAAALARVAESPNAMYPDPAKLEEAKSLLDSVPVSPELEPWRTMTAALLLREEQDAKGYRREIERAFREGRGHPAVASWRASLDDGAEPILLALAVEAAKREPRVVWRMLKGHFPPLDREAAKPMSELQRVLRKRVAESPDDVDLLLSLRTAVFLDGRSEESAGLDRSLLSRDTGLAPLLTTTAGPGAASAGGDPNEARLMMAMGKDGADRIRELEEILKDGSASPAVAFTACQMLAAAASALEPPDTKRALSAMARGVALGANEPFFLARFARAAAEAGESQEAAERAIDAALTRILRGEPRLPEPNLATIRFGGPEVEERVFLAELLRGRAALRKRRGDDRGERGDLRLATLLVPEDSRTLSDLGEVEEKLGRSAEALEAWIEAAARNASPEAKKRLEAAAADRYLFADATAIVADRKGKLGAAEMPIAPPIHPLVGKAAAPFELPGLSGDRVSLASYSGRPVVLDFWATWCKPCREEMKALVPVVAEYREKGVIFLALSTDSDEDWKSKVPKFVKEQAIGMTVVHADEASQTAFRVSGIPTLAVVGKDGKVTHYSGGFGGRTKEDLTKALDEALR